MKTPKRRAFWPAAALMGLGLALAGCGADDEGLKQVGDDTTGYVYVPVDFEPETTEDAGSAELAQASWNEGSRRHPVWLGFVVWTQAEDPAPGANEYRDAKELSESNDEHGETELDGWDAHWGRRQNGDDHYQSWYIEGAPGDGKLLEIRARTPDEYRNVALIITTWSLTP
ncbi:MAG: hypothetical protein LBK95_09940 [Bifidobacteriaceae bacterium]|jgi:hypothetical protein|nr:hypothetical protein [Bifidobacteriaceae bacterium]